MNSRRRRDDGFHENSFSHLLSSPFRFVSRRLEGWFGEHDRGFDQRGPGEVLVAIITFPFRLLWAFAIFMVQAWTISRNGFAFARSIPAIMGGLVMFALLWAVNARYEKNILITNARYLKISQDFPEHPEYAELYAEKLVEFRPEDPLYKYYLGLSRERTGNINSARRIMRQLANEDTAGFAPAHVWLGRDFAYAKDINLSESERQEKAIRHFQLALETEPNNLYALIGMSEIYEKKNDLTTASDFLRRVVQMEWTNLVQLRVIPKLVKMQQEMGKEEEAKRMLHANMETITTYSRRFPDLIEIWATLVQCATMLKDYDQALDIIDQGYQTAKTAEVRENLLGLLAAVHIMKADEVTSIEDKDSFQERLFALCEAIKTNPRSRDAYTRLIDFAAPDTLADEKARWLRESVIECPNPAVIHVILGMQDIKNGDFVQGQKHWKIADEQFELSQFIVNNMIELAVANKPEAFGNLLDMITVAMELFPDQAALYQTRGLYYKNQKQYAEAVKDLEFVSSKMPSLISSRSLLKECYLALDDQSNAQRVQAEIDVLVNKLDDAQRKMVEDFMKKSKEEQEQRQEQTKTE
jgi:tetratricopeptide (TPR) repeat protein